MKIIAMVRFNREWAYVFDEPVELKYREETIDGKRFLIGQHGPFYDFLQYEKAQGRFKAFAGREMTIVMEDGSKRKIKDDWWSCGSPIGELVPITYNIKEELKRCYVYYGAYVCGDALAKLTEEYETRTSGVHKHPAGGWRYDYYDFEKIIKYDDARKAAIRRQMKLEQANRHLVESVKTWAARARAKPRFRVPAISVRREVAA